MYESYLAPRRGRCSGTHIPRCDGRLRGVLKGYTEGYTEGYTKLLLYVYAFEQLRTRIGQCMHIYMYSFFIHSYWICIHTVIHTSSSIDTFIHLYTHAVYPILNHAEDIGFIQCCPEAEPLDCKAELGMSSDLHRSLVSLRRPFVYEYGNLRQRGGERARE